MTTLNATFLKAALTRAIKTAAQTALGMFTVGAAISDINWLNILSVSAVAAVYSILNNIATGIPETAGDALMLVDIQDPDNPTYSLQSNLSIEELAAKSSVNIGVTTIK